MPFLSLAVLADVSDNALHAAVLWLALFAALLLLSSYLLYRRMRTLQRRVVRAQQAAQEAARAAAMAAPGGIDPDAVLAVLSAGLPPTLDNVYMLMRRREAERAAPGAAVAAE